MAYSLDSLNDGCYKNSSVLINKFDIRNQKQLDIAEQNITSVLIAKAFIEIPFKNVDFEFYKSLHKYVFSDIYKWAGKIRNVNMSKKGTNFCPVDKIEDNGKRIFKNISSNSYMKNFSKEDFLEEFTALYCELN